MRREEALLREVRHNYAVIYNWHRENGIRVFKQRHGDDVGQERSWFRKYIHVLEGMPTPDVASLDEMSAVAGEVLCGCMEWSCGIEVEPGVALHAMARRIQEILRKAQEGHKTKEDNETDEEHVERVLRTLSNIGSGPQDKPMFVEIRIGLQQLTPETYARFGGFAYADVARHTQVENLGGAVALADTNLEIEHNRSAGISSEGLLRFWNAKAMHFIESHDKGTIAALARDGCISIESIRIGG